MKHTEENCRKLACLVVENDEPFAELGRDLLARHYLRFPVAFLKDAQYLTPSEIEMFSEVER